MYLLRIKISTISITSTMAMVAIPVAILRFSAMSPMTEGIRMEPRLAVVRIKLQAREYLRMISPAKDTVVA